MVQNCTLFDQNLQGYDDEECSGRYCFSCDFEKEVFFNLKGICLGSTMIDSDYFLKFDSPKTGNFFLWGFSGLTSIAYILDGDYANSWVLTSHKLKGPSLILGYYNDKSSAFPIGLKKWQMKTTCEIVTKDFEEVTLKLSKVRFDMNNIQAQMKIEGGS